jgi:hypothetical protein
MNLCNSGYMRWIVACIAFSRISRTLIRATLI